MSTLIFPDLWYCVLPSVTWQSASKAHHHLAVCALACLWPFSVLELCLATLRYVLQELFCANARLTPNGQYAIHRNAWQTRNGADPLHEYARPAWVAAGLVHH